MSVLVSETMPNASQTGDNRIIKLNDYIESF